MRILHVIPSIAPSDGGPSHAMVAIERALARAGGAVMTATTDYGISESGFINEENLYATGKIKRFYARKRINFYKVAPGLAPWLWAHVRDFDAVHIHALFSFPSVAAALIARRRGVPYIIRPLGTLTAYGMTRRANLKRASFALIEGPILRNAAAVHFTSEQEEREAHALNIAMRSVVIPLGVEEMGGGDASSLEASYPGLRGKLAILFISRVDPKKNIEALLEAYASNDTAKRTALLLIAGSGDASYRQRLRNQAQTLGIADRVIWLGHIDGQLKQDAFARADVFVLPSFSENFGIAAAEAMLAGLPSILGEGVALAKPAAAVGAAFAVAPEASCVASALDRLISDKDLRENMGMNARAHAQQRYSTEAMAKSLIGLYQNISKKTDMEQA